MDPIKPAKGTYSKPPGVAADTCPHCGQAVPKPKPITNQTIFAPTPPPMPPLPTFLRQTEQQETGQAKIPSAKTTEIPQPKPEVAAKPAAPARSGDPLDDPRIGGKVTIFALLYGDDVNLHRRCLASICETVPPHRMDLRVVTNQVGTETLNLIHTFPVTHLNADTKGRRKCEAMREVFQDATQPITTKWLIWFDDVAFVRHGKWLHTLAKTILAQPAEERVAILGRKLRHTLAAVGKDPRRWFTNASWWQGRPFRNKLGADATNGDQIHFVSSNFFALRTDTIVSCGIPDSRLRQSGSGIAIGEQLHQAGFKAKAFSDDGFFVASEQGNVKRGFKEGYPWQ